MKLPTVLAPPPPSPRTKWTRRVPHPVFFEQAFDTPLRESSETAADSHSARVARVARRAAPVGSPSEADAAMPRVAEEREAGEEEEEGGGDGTVRGGGALCAPYNAPHKEEPGHTMATVAAEQARCVAPAARPPGARSARAPPRRVQLVREEGRDVSGLYGREGGGTSAPPHLRDPLAGRRLSAALGKPRVCVAVRVARGPAALRPAALS